MNNHSRPFLTPLCALLLGCITSGTAFAAAPTVASKTPLADPVLTLTDPVNKTTVETTTFTLTFSEPVNGFGIDDFTVTKVSTDANASAHGSITNLAQDTANRAKWTVTFIPTYNVDTTAAKITLNLAGITDAAGVPGTGTVDIDPFTINTVQATAALTLPAVEDADKKSIRYTTGQALTFTLKFTRAVNLSNGTPRLKLKLDTVDNNPATDPTVYANFVGITADGKDLTFTYTVEAGDEDPSGVTVISPIDLNGSIINDNVPGYANAPLITFAPGDTSKLFVDTLPPRVNAITRLSASPTSVLDADTKVRFRAHFSEPVTDAKTDDFTLVASSGVTTKDFTVIGADSATQAATGLTIDLEVTVNKGSSGTLGLNVNANATLPDLSTRTYASSGQGGFTNGQVYQIINQAAAANSLANGFGSAAAGGLQAGAVTAITVINETELRAYAEANTNPYVITLINSINLTAPLNLNSNKTLQGQTLDTALVGEIKITAPARNIVIRGLNLSNPGGAALTLDQGRDVFITHCAFASYAAEALVLKNTSDLVTVSWSDFASTNTGIRIGEPTGELFPSRVTLHHNELATRVLVNRGYVHLYNNYFTTAGAAAATTVGNQAELLAERNKYANVTLPLAKTGNGKIRTFENDVSAEFSDAIFSPSYGRQLHPLASVITEAAKAGNNNGAYYTDETLSASAIGGIGSTGTSAAVPRNSAFTLRSSFASATGQTITVSNSQWRRDYVNLANATGTDYTVTSAANTDAGVYSLAQTLSNGQLLISPSFTISITEPLPPVEETPEPAAGGSPSLWFVGALSALAALRLRRSDH